MRFTRSSGPGLAPILLAVAASLVLACTQSPAQVPTQLYAHPEWYVLIQDGIHARLEHDGQILDTNEYCHAASYWYEMIYDSTNRVDYLFSECKLNNGRIRLRNWNYGRLSTAPLSEYNDSSRTDEVTLGAGDTISFYRHFQWYNPMTKKQTFSNYFATDTLDFVVELMDATTGLRLALLDSFGALPRVPAGSPVLYGLHPIMAVVGYPVPAAMAGKRAFVHVRIDARGDGLYQPIRSDDPSVGLSRALRTGMYDDYLRLFGDLGKQAGRWTPATTEKKSNGRLHVTVTGGRHAVISFEAPQDGIEASLVVYDALGNPVFIPFVMPNMTGRQTVDFQFPSSGVFLVVLRQNDEVLSTTKVVVD